VGQGVSLHMRVHGRIEYYKVIGLEELTWEWKHDENKLYVPQKKRCVHYVVSRNDNNQLF
jgi:hypothetical protein